MSLNLEAADEISRQLRLRDMGGLIVIDFIDMLNNRNQREVENKLREQLKMDRARVQIGRISRFGLLEMSRQRLRPSLGESSHIPCPRCEGQGTIRGTESLSLSVLRIIEEEALKDLTAKVIIQLPVDAATFLLNEKRSALHEIEHRLDVEVILIPNPSLETPQYQIQRVRISEAEAKEAGMASYKLTSDTEEVTAEIIAEKPAQKTQEPALKQIIHKQPVPVTQGASTKSKGLISRLFGSLFGIASEDETRDSIKKESPKNKKKGRQRQRSYDRTKSQSARTNKSGGRKPGSRRRNAPGEKQRNRQGSRASKNISENNSRQSSQGNSNVRNNSVKPAGIQDKPEDAKPQNAENTEMVKHKMEDKPAATGDNMNYSANGDIGESYKATDITEKN